MSIRGVVGAAAVGLLLGCGGVLTTSTGTVTGDGQRHLESVYGESFTIHKVVNQSNEGTGIIDQHDLEASSSSLPNLVFTGTANYDVDPPRFTDTYRCAQLLPALKAKLAPNLAPHVQVANDHVWCKNDRLPLHPTLDGDLSALSWNATVHSYTDDPLEAAVADARTLALARNERLGLPPTKVDVLVFPAALQPSADAIKTGFLTSTQRYRGISRAGKPLVPSVELPKLREQVADRLAPLLPSGAQLDVTFDIQGGAAKQRALSLADLSLDDLPNDARRQVSATLHVAVFEQEVDEAALIALSESITAAIELPWTLYFSRYSPVDGNLWSHPEALKSVGIRYSRSMQDPTYMAPGFILGPGPGARTVP